MSTSHLEQGVADETHWDGKTFLGDMPSEASQLRSCIEEADGRQDLDMEDLLSRTLVLGTTWSSLTQATSAEVAKVTSLTPSQRLLAVRELRSLVADTSDANAQRDYDQAERLTRSAVLRHLTDLVEDVDSSALDEAIGDGLCEPFGTVAPSSTGDRFYEGLAAQPAHAAAGLIVPRWDVLDPLHSALRDHEAALLVGPSGVGKSCVLWTVPESLPGVAPLWQACVRRVMPGQ